MAKAPAKMTVQRAAGRLVALAAKGKGKYAVIPNTITVDDAAKTVSFTETAAVEKVAKKGR
jgi:hypothetical protein